MKKLICRLFHRKYHYADYEGKHIVNKNGSYRCMGCEKCHNGWYEKRPPMHTVCVVLGHRFYQGIAGYGSDGTPYPGKFCYDCDYAEEM